MILLYQSESFVFFVFWRADSSLMEERSLVCESLRTFLEVDVEVDVGGVGGTKPGGLNARLG